MNKCKMQNHAAQTRAFLAQTRAFLAQTRYFLTAS